MNTLRKIIVMLLLLSAQFSYSFDKEVRSEEPTASNGILRLNQLFDQINGSYYDTDKLQCGFEIEFVNTSVSNIRNLILVTADNNKYPGKCSGRELGQINRGACNVSDKLCFIDFGDLKWQMEILPDLNIVTTVYEKRRVYNPSTGSYILVWALKNAATTKYLKR